ncbi:DUF1127 domain-containing protein [Jannaschia sp. 2305UL9-9]|uniref:DUF1127 domain-containing protein n=1 Tax=Jannaschia sp. 2305UL9-9 TaxID=3121638 RepID=UPI003527D943
MAFTTYGNTAGASISLRDRLVARLATLRTDWANWRLYRQTVNELSDLSNRELADLGLSRSMIRSIALEAAYGK